MNIAAIISTVFGIGKIKYAPGTFASIITVMPFIFLGVNTFLIAILVFLLFLLGIKYSNEYSTAIQIKDPSEIVIDEVVGILVIFLICADMTQPITTALEKKLGLSITPKAARIIYVLLTLTFFRFFDILKPFPVSFFDQKIEGGIGIMMDDVVAGIISGMIIMTIRLIH